MLAEAEVRAIKARAERAAKWNLPSLAPLLAKTPLDGATIVFLGAARSDVPALCDEVLRLQAREKELQQWVNALDYLAAGRQQMLLEVTKERDALQAENAALRRILRPVAEAVIFGNAGGVFSLDPLVVSEAKALLKETS